MSTSQRHATAGFTLFEVIVVMVITSLMGAVLTQGFGMILAARLSVTSAIENLQEVVLSQNIPVDPLRGVLPDFKAGPGQFRGEPRFLSGQTLRPLLSAPGAPTRFTMTLDYETSGDTTVLIYEEPGRPKVVLAKWPGNTQSFKYRDITGVWEPSWPTKGGTSQTPWVIWIDAGPTLTPLMASVQGPHSRVTRLQDSPFGSAASPFAN